MKEEAACNEKITTRKGEVTMKRTLSVVLGAAMVFSLAACGGKGGDPSSETKAQNAEADTANTASADPGLETEITSTDPITIRLAYDVAESHPSHKAFVEKFQNALQRQQWEYHCGTLSQFPAGLPGREYGGHADRRS